MVEDNSRLEDVNAIVAAQSGRMYPVSSITRLQRYSL